MPAPHGPSAALVLGSGGVLGASFHAGVLLALQEAWNLDCRLVDEILGTSAGALTGSFIVAGLSAPDLMRREQGHPLSKRGQKIMARRPTRQTPPADPQMVSLGMPASPNLFWSALQKPGAVMPGTVVSGLLPRGRIDTGPIRDTVDGLLQETWPEAPRFKVVTVKLTTGTRRVFIDTDRVSPGTAVAAACSVPAIHRPARIAAEEYIDGAVHSANNLDAVGGADLVIVSSPSTSSDSSLWPDPLNLGRRGLGLQLEAEMREVRTRARVVIIEPDKSVISAMGVDIMRTDHRAAVAIAAHQMASRRLRVLDHPFRSAPKDSP